MKKILFTFVCFNVLSFTVLAEDIKKTPPAQTTAPAPAEKPTSKKDEEENAILASLISQIVEEMSKPSFDLEFEKMTFDTNDNAKFFSVESFKLKAQVSFSDDIVVDFVRDETGAVEGTNVKRFRTFLVLGTKGLVFDIQGKGSDSTGNLEAKFFTMDPKTKQLVNSILRADVKSKITESLIKIDFHSLSFNWKPDAKNKDLTLISGVAITEKQLWDIRNQRYLPKVAHVSFTGSFGKDSKPKISISYINQAEGTRLP